MNENRLILEAFERSKKTGVGAALATIVRTTGSSYRRPGAKMLVSEDGEITGALSGGCLERDLIQRARWAILRSEPKVVRYDTRFDAEDEIETVIQTTGLGCGGTIDIFINPAPDEHLRALENSFFGDETIAHLIALPDGTEFRDPLVPPTQLLIFGAGHDAVPLSRFALEMGWAITVVDSRSSYPVPKRLFGEARQLISCPADQLVQRVRITDRSVIVLMTHNFDHDRLILKQISDQQVQFRYLGLLGPRSRAERLFSELEKENVSLPADRIFYPAGLDIGGETPEAIALAILAEAQAVLSGRKGGFLRESSGPIHR